MHNTDLANEIIDIELRLDRVSRLVVAAEYRLDRDKAEAGFESATTEMELQELFNQVDKIEKDLASLSEDVNVQESVEGLIATAKGEVEVVNSKLGPLLPGGNRVKECRVRMIGLRERIREISRRNHAAKDIF